MINLKNRGLEDILFFAFPLCGRKIIYTNNAIESLNPATRQTIKIRGSFSTDEAATKLIYQAIQDYEKKAGFLEMASR